MRRALSLLAMFIVMVVLTDSASASTSVACGSGDSSTVLQNAINFASTHPDAGIVGRSGVGQGVVTVGYPNTCRIFGVVVKSNVRVIIDSGVTFKQYGSAAGNLFLMNGTNSSLLLGNANHSNGHWTINVDAKVTGGNPDIHPINVTGSYLDIRGPYLIGNWGEASVPVTKSKYKSTSGMIHYGGPDYVWLSNASAVHQPAGYGLTEISNGSNLTFAGLSSQGGYALRLETNPCKSTEGISNVQADDISSRNGVGTVDLSAHNLSITNVNITNVSSQGSARGIHITNAGGVCENGGGQVSGTVSMGCEYGGTSAQLISGNDTWTIGESIVPVDKIDPSLQVTVSKIGASGPFSQGFGSYVDPSVVC